LAGEQHRFHILLVAGTQFFANHPYPFPRRTATSASFITFRSVSYLYPQKGATTRGTGSALVQTIALKRF